jgi:hypothetical protein
LVDASLGEHVDALDLGNLRELNLERRIDAEAVAADNGHLLDLPCTQCSSVIE